MIYESFPEAYFHVDARCVEDYRTRLYFGQQNAANNNVLICGLIRNASDNFSYLRARIEKIGSMFNSYEVFLYENDSSDNTVPHLKNWQKKNNRVMFSSEKLDKKRHEQDHSLQRRIDMANYRNQYMAYIKGSNTNYDKIIVLDTDLIGGYSYEGISHSMSFNFPVIASNSILFRVKDGKVERLFYDAWAFRQLNQTEAHPDNDVNLLVFNRGESPVKVNSAFGGMAIYDGMLLKQDSLFYDDTDCDHVTLHEKIRKLGIEIYLNPSQITLYSPTLYTAEVKENA